MRWYDDHSDALVTISFNPENRKTTWRFARWTNNYRGTPSVKKVEIDNTFPVQAIVTGKLTGNSQASVVQLYYGTSTYGPRQFDIKIFQPLESGTGDITLQRHWDNTFIIDWPASLSSDFHNWFLSDIDGDGNADLVGYVFMTRWAILEIAVFPGKLSGGFDEPVLSVILIPEGRGNFLLSKSTSPVFTRQATSSCKVQGQDHLVEDDRNILGFYDNFVLGVIMVGPNQTTGQFNYTLKGQTPAIAGQLSKGLGWRPENHTRRGEPGVAIGFADCCQGY